MVEVVGDFTAKIKVATLSQPAEFKKLAVYVPAALQLLPFQTKGKLLEQTEVIVVEVVDCFTVKIKVATLSQPAELIKLAV